MTTPEQLAKWREEFAKAFPARPLSAYGHPPNDNDYVFAGYLRAKQENKQNLKDARKQALEDVAEGLIKQKSWLREYAYAVVEHAAEEGSIK